MHGLTLQAQALWERADAASEIGSAPRETVPTLLVAGSGPWDDELRHLVEELKLERIEILGPLPPEELRRALARARFSVLPSEWYENAPMALLESLAAGRPVAGARIGGIPELIEDGVDGVLFPAGNPEALLAGLKRARALGPEARVLAREKVERESSRPLHMQRLTQILTEVQGYRSHNS